MTLSGDFMLLASAALSKALKNITYTIISYK